MSYFKIYGNVDPSDNKNLDDFVWNHVNIDKSNLVNYTFEELDKIVTYIKSKTKKWYFINLDDVFPKWYLEGNKTILDVLKKHNLNFEIIDTHSKNTQIGITNRENDTDYKNILKNKKIKKKFLSLNGSPSSHREEIYNFLMNYSNIKKDVFLSYNSKDPTHKNHLKIEGNEYTKESNRLNNLYYHSFCNIVTETDFSDGHIHITEKTDKSIFALQPFVIVGNPYSLQRLKELGFKTFGKWWDESYDLEKYDRIRMFKIKQTIKEINKFSVEELINVYEDMKDVLIHNKELAKKIYNNNKKYHDNFVKIYQL